MLLKPPPDCAEEESRARRAPGPAGDTPGPAVDQNSAAIGRAGRRDVGPAAARREVGALDPGAEVLRSYPTCPVCGGGERERAECPGSANRYVRAVERVTDLCAAEFAERIHTWRCVTCHAVFCDPWLSATAAAQLYGVGFSQHVNGWRTFYGHLGAGAGGDDPCDTVEPLAGFLREAAAPLECYAELNCPFSGLLPYFARREDPARLERRRWRRARAWIGLGQRHPPAAGRALRRVAGHVARRGGARGREAAGPARPSRVPGVPATRRLLVAQSSLCWGTNCVAQGVTCHAVSAGLLDAPVITLEDARREGLRFDAVLLTNLDHFFEPMALLEYFLASARLVLIAGHASGRFSRQHLFCLPPDFDVYLRRLGHRAVDLSARLVPSSRRSTQICVAASRELPL